MAFAEGRDGPGERAGRRHATRSAPPVRSSSCCCRSSCSEPIDRGRTTPAFQGASMHSADHDHRVFRKRRPKPSFRVPGRYAHRCRMTHPAHLVVAAWYVHRHPLQEAETSSAPHPSLPGRHRQGDHRRRRLPRNGDALLVGTGPLHHLAAHPGQDELKATNA